MTEAFFLAEDDEVFVSTKWTVGPWSTDSQHAGPPSALLGRALERVINRPDMQIVRATFEILRPVPVVPLHIHAEVLRRGRSVTLAAASVSDEQGIVMRAQGWGIRIAELDLEEVVHGEPPPAGPEAGMTATDVFVTEGPSYLAAIEWRFVRGGFVEPGPATAWGRMRHPLVDGEQITPLTRVLVLADSGNGISSALDWSRWVFINPDLTVYLHRLPRSEWVCLDAQTTIEPSGIGLATSTLSDQDGVIGRGVQSLFVAPRP